MEFDLFDLDRILMSLSNEQQSANAHSGSRPFATEHKQSSGSNEEHEQKPPPIVTAKSDRTYCLIIFNNPRWSERLRKQSKQLTQQQLQHVPKQSEHTAVKKEKQDASVDDVFIAQLRQLLKDYMQRTARPFPLKYFLDFTEQ